MPFDTVKKHIIVSAASNKYDKGIPYPKKPIPFPINPRDIHVNKQDVKPIIYNVLYNDPSNLRRNKEIIDIDFIFKPNGEVTDIVFGLRENTLITIQEIEDIDQQLRANIKATFTGTRQLQYEAFDGPMMPRISF